MKKLLARCASCTLPITLNEHFTFLNNIIRRAHLLSSILLYQLLGQVSFLFVHSTYIAHAYEASFFSSTELSFFSLPIAQRLLCRFCFYFVQFYPNDFSFAFITITNTYSSLPYSFQCETFLPLCLKRECACIVYKNICTPLI